MSLPELPCLVGPRVEARLPRLEDVPAIIEYFSANREHLGAWDPARPDGFYSESYWRERVPAFEREYRSDVSARFFVLLRSEPGRVVGTANLTQIFRGPFQACYLGYGVAADQQGKGIMREALERVIAHAFGPMNLHRIMANHLPENARSAALLERLGFRVEGVAKDYLRIGGAWRDHVLTALANPGWREGS